MEVNKRGTVGWKGWRNGSEKWREGVGQWK